MPAQYRSKISFGFKMTLVLSLAASTAVLLSACGGNGGTEPNSKVATTELVVTPTVTVAKLFYGTPISFPNGIPAFGIDTAVTLTLAANPSDTNKPAFLIKNDVDSVKGFITIGTTAKTAATTASPVDWTFTSIFSSQLTWLSIPQSTPVVFQSSGLVGAVLLQWTPLFSIQIGSLFSAPVIFEYHLCYGPYGTVSVSLNGLNTCSYDLGEVGVVDASGLN